MEESAETTFSEGFTSQCPIMTEIEVPSCECNNISSLASREERAALLKAGFTSKDIESQYLRLNGIIVIGVNWQDSNVRK